MATPVSELVAEVQRHLYGTYRSEFAALGAAMTNVATTMTIEGTSMGGITKGAIVSIDDELIYVRSVTGQVATVFRGWLGSTAAAHNNGAVVEVNPRYPVHSIRQALRDEVLSWPVGLFRVGVLTLLGTTGERAVELTGLPATFISILDVRVRASSNLTSGYRRATYRDLVSVVPGVSAGQLVVDSPGLGTGDDVAVWYAYQFNPTDLASATDVETTWGLAITQTDIPPLGAAWRLLLQREGIRVDTHAQGTSGKGEDTPAGAALEVAAGLKQLRDERIRQEVAKVRARYPITGV